MIVTTGWDVLMLTVRTTPEGAEVRVGVVFVLALTWIAYKVLDGWDEDDGPKATA